MLPERFNAKEIAEILGVHERTVSRHIRDDKLPASKPGRFYVITLDDLAAYLESRERAEAVVKAWTRRRVV
jgi:excisionase family DNA binding protein